MCGITGVFGPAITKTDLGAFYQLMFVNQLRGMHSTGVLRVFSEFSKRKPDIRKDVVPAQEFLNRKENDNLFDEISPVAVMGHCRHATVGNADNILGAHPFENERYIGFHNGTLREKKYTDGTFFTDSETLYNEMAEKSPEEVLPVLQEDSAFALAYYDKEKHTISFVRNKHRPLAFAVNTKRNVVYYSSEIDMLEFVLDRMGIEYESYSLREWTLATCTPARVNFNDDEVRKDKKIPRTNLWKIRSLTPRPTPKPEPVQTDRSALRGWYNELWGDGGDVVSSKSIGSSTPQCANCNSTLVYHKGTGQEVKDKNPKLIEDFGIVCPDCMNAFVNNNQVTQSGQIICN